MPVDPWPYFREGWLVRVRVGPLRSVEGIVVRRQSVSRMVLRVAALGQAVAMGIDAGLLETLD